MSGSDAVLAWANLDPDPDTMRCSLAKPAFNMLPPGSFTWALFPIPGRSAAALLRQCFKLPNGYDQACLHSEYNCNHGRNVARHLKTAE